MTGTFSLSVVLLSSMLEANLGGRKRPNVMDVSVEVESWEIRK